MARTEKLYLKGTSVDTKPNLGSRYDGSEYLELDTGLTYIYYGNTGVWSAERQGQATESTVGISEVKKTKTEGKVDTYTIFYTNGMSTTFTVTNGSDQIEFGTSNADSRFAFPSIGKNGILYIAEDELASYIWKDDRYQPLNTSGGVPREIDGGDAKTKF